MHSEALKKILTPFGFHEHVLYPLISPTTPGRPYITIADIDQLAMLVRYIELALTFKIDADIKRNAILCGISFDSTMPSRKKMVPFA